MLKISFVFNFGHDFFIFKELFLKSFFLTIIESLLGWRLLSLIALQKHHDDEGLVQEICKFRLIPHNILAFDTIANKPNWKWKYECPDGKYPPIIGYDKVKNEEKSEKNQILLQ